MGRFVRSFVAWCYVLLGLRNVRPLRRCVILFFRLANPAGTRLTKSFRMPAGVQGCYVSQFFVGSLPSAVPFTLATSLYAVAYSYFVSYVRPVGVRRYR